MMEDSKLGKVLEEMSRSDMPHHHFSELSAQLNDLEASDLPPSENESVAGILPCLLEVRGKLINDEARNQWWDFLERAVHLGGDSAESWLVGEVWKGWDGHKDYGAWAAAVKLLRVRRCYAAAPYIAEGFVSKYNGRAFVDSFADEDVKETIRAIQELDLPELGDFLEQLLSVEQGPLKGQVLFFLGDYGGKRAIVPLKKRLGGLLKKPERDPSVRSQIKDVIAEIKSRASTSN